MIYRGHVIDKMANVYQKIFLVRLKNEFITLLRVSYCLYFLVLLMENCVEQHNVYITLLGLVFHKLWKFETRYANARNLLAF